MSLSLKSVDAAGEAVLVARDLVVAYGRKNRDQGGLNGFTTSFRRGITGLVGPNGAGKTTFLRAAGGLLRPRSGTLRIQGLRPERFVASRGIGFLPENPVLPGYLTVEEFLEGLDTPEPSRGSTPASQEGRRGRHWMGRLEGLLKKPLSSLSLGQRKKVALSACLTHRPELLLLDEPTNGLDPMAVRELREILTAEGMRGATIIVSSHHLDELQRVADSLVFVKEGEVVGSWEQEVARSTFGSLEALFGHIFEGA